MATIAELLESILPLLIQQGGPQAAVAYRRLVQRLPFGEKPKIPLIAGRTDSPGAELSGMVGWLTQTPEERFWASDLGDAYSFSSEYDPMERNDPTAYARKIAAKGSGMKSGGDYWGGLARNIMYGGEMPEANLPFNAGVEGEPLVGSTAPGVPPRGTLPYAGGEVGVMPGPQPPTNVEEGRVAGDGQARALAVQLVQTRSETDKAAYVDYMQRTYGVAPGSQRFNRFFELHAGGR